MSTFPEKLIPAQDLQLCVICARGFTADRIKAHEQICRKSSWSKRKSFDISQQRIRGMEAENFSKIHIKDDMFHKVHEHRSPALSTNWRMKHEDFIKKVKNAKRLIQDKSPSKLNDLPVPPATELNENVQCPHCLRQINNPSAERHIKTCASMMYQMPKSKIGLTGNPKPKNSLSHVAKK